MAKEWSEDELKQIAGQLGKPDGDNGIKVAERMAENNAGMTGRTIQTMNVREQNVILEIGHGNASHVGLLFKGATDIRYFGVDISQTMIEEAERMNADLVKSGNATFQLSDGENLPFADETFDKIFTVNTLYFWGDPISYGAEIYRVLKPEGIFVLTIADKSFMEKLPFTQYGFWLYDREAAEALLTDAGFGIVRVTEELDITTGILGQAVEREILIITASKS